EQVHGAHRVVGTEQELAEAREVRGAGDLGQDRRPPVFQHRLATDPGGEAEAEQPFADERGADAHETPMMEEGEACARARPTRGGVDLARTPDEGVARHPAGIRQLVDEHVVHARLPEIRCLDLELGVHCVAYGHAPLGDSLREVMPYRQARPPRPPRPGSPAATMAKTWPAPTAMSTGTSPTPSTSMACPGSATNDGVHRRVTSRTRSPAERAMVSTTPASVSMTTEVSLP